MNRKVSSVLTIVTSCALLSFNTFAGDNLNNESTSMQQMKQSTKSAVAEAELKAAAMKELGIYNKDVTVMVKDNTVYLIGELPSNVIYEEVVTKVESSKIIKNIDADKLTVKNSQQPLKDTYITAKIKGSLIKHDLFDKDIPSWSISVETKNGVVYLSGTVKTEKDKLSVLNVVKSVDDVKEVKDTIKVLEIDDEQQ